MRRDFEVWSDGSYRNYSAWYETSRTCTAVKNRTETEYQTLACPSATPSGTWKQSRTYDLWTDGSKKNYSAWTDVSTCYNQAPTVNNRTLTIAEDTSGTLTLTASDDHSSFVFEIVGSPANGSASISGSTLTFTPAPDWNGTTTLTYRAKDPAGAYSAPATVTITVTPVNDPPVAQNKTLVTDEDTPKSVTLSATDIDSPVPTVFEIVTPPNPAHGSVSLTGNSALFTPAKDWNGSTSFTYRAKDSGGLWSAPATVSVIVNPVNDAPVIQSFSRHTNSDQAKTIGLIVQDPDIGDTHTFSLPQALPPSVGQAKISGTTLTFTPAKGWSGSVAFEYVVTDSAGATATAKATITATPLFQVVSSCRTPLAGDDFRFVLADAGESGLDVDSVAVRIDFGSGQPVTLPVTIENLEALRQQKAAGTWPEVVTVTTGSILSVPAVAEAFERANHLSAARGGQVPYTFTVEVTSRDGKKRTHSQTYDPIVREDTQAPTLSIFAGAADSDGTVMRDIGDVTLRAIDDKTGMDYMATELALTVGQRRVAFFLPPAEQGGVASNRCVARKPLSLTYTTAQMAYEEPALLELLTEAYLSGQPLTLEFAVEDFAGNKASMKKVLTFAPDVLTVAETRIPGLQHVFNRRNDRPVVRVAGREAAIESGVTVDYLMRLRNAGDVQLNVNGKTVGADGLVELGSFTLGTNQNIDLEIAAAADRVSGSATLLLVPKGKGGRLVEIPLTAWLPEVELTSKNWKPVQLFQPANATAVQKNGVACKITGVLDLARNADPIAEPLCLIEWATLPPDTYGLSQNTPEMSGRIPEVGTFPVHYQVVLFDTDGSRFVMAEGERSFEVGAAGDVMAFSLGKRLDNSYRIVREVNGSLNQDSGPNCATLTTNEDYALDLSARNTPACLIKWDRLPEGIAARAWTDQPLFDGVFAQREGDARFAWTVSSFSTKGVPVAIGSGQQIVPLQDPPTPLITMDTKQKLTDGLYWAQMAGGLVGDYTVEALNARLKVQLSEAGEVIDSDETAGGFNDKLVYRGRLISSEKPLWSRTPYTIDARYSAIPDIEASHSLAVLAVPDVNLRPDVAVAETTVLNTELFNIESWIGNPFGKEPYSADRMGEWDIRMLNYLSYSNQQPLTEYQAIDGAGKANFQLDLKALDSTFLRLMPQARLKSPVPEYQREVMGARPLYVTILRGEAIDSQIVAQRIKGEAPLSLMAKLDLTNRLDYKALGDVKWEMRKIVEPEEPASPNTGAMSLLRTMSSLVAPEAEASDWQPVESRSTISDRFQYIFDVGRYELRARVHNKHSGAEFTTGTIEVHAYSVPVVKVEGPANAFIGSEAKLRINARLGSEPVPAEDLVVQWSEDNGKTWVDGGIEHRLTRSEEERVYLMSRVRMANAPADWEDSYVQRRHRVSFRQVAPPRGSIVGPRVIEAGKSVDWRGTARAPYPRMDVSIKGRFILPDGQVVDADAVKYLPTMADATKERVDVTYEAWIEGFEEQGARAQFTRMIRVWQYEWPEWSFRVRTSATQAPADVDIRVTKPFGTGRYLENLQYEWTLPEGVEVLKGDDTEGRVLRISEPGTYPVHVTISDDRGNVSEISENLVIDAADPWKVDFRMTTSNADNRAPLDVRFFPNVGGGHPRDRIDVHRYLINGQVVADNTRYAATTLQDGEHEITLEIESAFGKVGRHSKTLSVKPNTPPVCKLDASKTDRYHRFAAKCTDETGTVRRHVWTVNGEVLAISSSRISVSARDSGPLHVTLKAIDDGGAESEEVRWNGSVTGTGG